MSFQQKPRTFWNSDVFHSIEDLENLLYSVRAVGEQIRADDPFTTTTPGLVNPRYGLNVWSQINYEKVPLEITPTDLYTQSGFIAHTKDQILPDNGGVSENGVMPELDKGDYVQIRLDPKIIAASAGETLKKELLASISDDTIGGMTFVRNRLAKVYTNAIATQVMRSAKEMARTASANFNYFASNQISPYDQLVSSMGENTAKRGNNRTGFHDCYGGGAANPTNLGAVNVGMDRDSSTLFDSTVTSCSEDGEGDFTKAGIIVKPHFTNTIAKIKDACGVKPNVILCTHEMQAEIMHLYDGDVWYNPDNTIRTGLGGIQGETGIGVQKSVVAIQNIPVLETRFAIKDSNDTNEEGAILMLRTDVDEDGQVLALSTLLPTVEVSSMYGYANHQADLKNRTGLITVAELALRRPNTCGKITNIIRRRR